MSWWSRLTGGRPVDTIDDEPLSFEAPDRRAAPRDRRLPRFRQASSLTLDLGRSDTERARLLVRDAFTPSQPVNDHTMFAGRRALLEELIVAIEDQRLHFVLYGDRGIGKTSILRVLTKLAEEAGYLVCYMSCGDSATFSEFARRIASRIPLLYHSGFAPGSQEIEQGRTLADIMPEGEIDVPLFAESLTRIDKTRVLMMMDEFDRVESPAFRRDIAAMIKILSDGAAHAQIIIAGVAPDLSELIAQIPSIRRNILGVMVPNMTDEEVSEMIDLAEGRSGLDYQDGARELIGLAALGLPYLVGLVAQHAALIATDRGSLTVSKDDVRAAIRKARGELSGRIGARTLHAISAATREDQLIELGKLAHAALRGGGVLPPELVPAGFREGATDDAKAFRLLEPIEDDPLQRWHFIDDGASILIWLSALSSD